jgi:hypothetical protein
MERCLYCGEPIALLQRWKLGRAKGMFCSPEHEHAHTELQAQAVMRLVLSGEPEPVAAAEVLNSPEPDSPDRAPAAMTARPQNSHRATPTANPGPFTRQLEAPPLEPAFARFFFAGCVAVQIPPTGIARPDPVRPQTEALAFTSLPNHSLSTRSVPFTPKMANTVRRSEWIRSTHPPPTTLSPQERNWTEIQVNLPVHPFETPPLALSVAGPAEVPCFVFARSHAGTFEPLPMEPPANVQFPRTTPPVPQPPSGARSPIKLELARPQEATPPSVSDVDSSLAILYPPFSSAVEPPPECPPFVIDPLIGTPLGASDRMTNLPLVLLTLNRGLRGGNQRLAFKSLPMQILDVPSEPLFFVEPLHFHSNRELAARSHAC